jgi:hypothetical protein
MKKKLLTSALLILALILTAGLLLVSCQKQETSIESGGYGENNGEEAGGYGEKAGPDTVMQSPPEGSTSDAPKDY